MLRAPHFVLIRNKPMRPVCSIRFALCLGLSASLGLSQPLAAAEFIVDSAEDSGEGSLREAIGLANGSAGPHSLLILVPGTGVNAVLASPLPPITTAVLSIDGSGSAGFRIDGQNLHRIFETGLGNQRLELRGLELRNGRAVSGGCLLIAPRADAEVHIDTVTFEGCTAQRGDGAAIGGAVHMPAGASLEITHSRFTGNGATGTGSGQRGGAIASSAATLDLRDSVFQNNQVSGGTTGAERAGGAVSVSGTAVSIVFARGNRFSGNTVTAGSAAFGGALDVSCAGCVVSLDAGYFGQNTAGLGGGIALRQGGSGTGLSASLGNLTIERNLADSGGGLYLAQASLDARNLSLQNNRAASGAHLRTGPGFALDRLTNSVFGRVDPAGGNSACQLAESVLAGGPLGGNLFAEAVSCGGLASSGSASLAAGVVATLDVAGGQMPVLAFPPGSGVIDRGGRQFACTLSDARDTERPIDGDSDGIEECDIGAYEHPAASLLFRNGFEPTP